MPWAFSLPTVSTTSGRRTHGIPTTLPGVPCRKCSCNWMLSTLTGTSMRVISDPTWKASTGPLLLDATRLGEVYDARLEKPGWAKASYDDSAWSAAILREGITGNLIAPDAEPIRITKTIAPIRIIPVFRPAGSLQHSISARTWLVGDVYRSAARRELP